MRGDEPGRTRQGDRHQRAKDDTADRVRTTQPTVPVDDGHHKGWQLQGSECLHTVMGKDSPDPDMVAAALHPLWITLDVPVSFTVPGLRMMIFFIVPLSYRIGTKAQVSITIRNSPRRGSIIYL
ncbi:hypothetical protein Mth01_40050 [Sphaerimonospora thailandensis]|uniref:Uncharacterized protein n=1 Tax=Sphaerimonospora thailandensis TaxID=795644 RepID=A0A8J3R9S5_9ACTN|nr:hypothetical protein Mth01_40050 [Sphaerimonospora thailandensis]